MHSKRWTAMQAIEDLRHRADLLEQKAAGCPGPRGDLYLRIAARMRELAEEETALAAAGAYDPARPLSRAS